MTAPEPDPPFACIVFAPAAFGPGAAISAARAGGLGILDICGCDEPSARRAFATLRSHASGMEDRFGVRFGPAEAEIGRDLLSALPPAAVAVLAWAGTDYGAMEAALAGGIDHPVIVEIPSIEAADRLDPSLRDEDGFLAVTAEAGGWAGSISGFLFAQAIAARRAAGDRRGWYLRGAVGPLAAMACRLAGLDGIALSDELLMFEETGVREDFRAILGRAEMSDFVSVGEHFGLPVRLLSLPDFPEARRFAQAKSIETIADAGARRDAWRAYVDKALRWGEPGSCLWPVGQGAALAARLAAEHRTVGRLVRTICRTPERLRAAAPAAAGALGGSGPLAAAEGIRHAVFQGPMTHVSDTPAFVAAVSAGGGVGALALALMPGRRTAEALASAHDLCGGQPFAVGLLGFAPPELLAAQMEAITARPPPFAIIAGGRVDLWRTLTDLGIKSYLHAPTPRMLSLFREQGADRFVLEGRECGGHVGPCHSFPLWEAAITDLLASGAAKGAHLLFAGGIHDALSAAMVSVMAAPLVEAGGRIGVLVGTAYLATFEATATGAITPDFQAQVLKNCSTALVVSGAGHANRCLDTRFAADFNERRRALLAGDAAPDTIREELDGLLLGRLRIATKGLRREGAELVELDAESQADNGMYMAGDVSRLVAKLQSIEDLHADLTAGADALLAGWAPRLGRPAAAQPRNVAVVGMSLLLPGAGDVESYWSNVAAGACAIREVPPERWDWRLIYEAEKRVGDCSNSRWGGFLDPIEFDPVRYGIPPSSVSAISTSQLLVLEMAQRALDDAGYGAGGFDRERTSVVVASADSGGFLGNELMARSVLPFVNGDRDDPALKRMPEWREESFVGVITSVVAGRVANRLDLGGANYTVDAACASGLTALALAADELTSGRADTVVVAAIDAAQTPYQYMAFSNVGALSPTGAARVFDRDADGTVISEGVIALVLKRLEDAERDGDRIYGVIRGAAHTSDGRTAGLTAPHAAGQRRALRRAYAEAGISPAAIEMYEAHGTGTPVGDRAELETISTLLAEADAAPRGCVIGSVKSLIGHTKTAAGLASLAKVLLALHHKVQPMHAVARPIHGLSAAGRQLVTLDRSRPWLSPGSGPRTAGVSAFGFGGTNCHVVVEEYRGALSQAARGGPVWPGELFIVEARDAAQLGDMLRQASRALTAPAPRLRDLARTLCPGPRTLPAAAIFVATGRDDALAKLDAIVAHLDRGTAVPAGAIVSLDLPAPAGEVAFLFPGQGVQRPYLGVDAAVYLNEVGELLEAAAMRLADGEAGALSSALFPEAVFDEESRAAQEARLIDTRIAQPAVGALSLGLCRFLARLGIRPDRVAGHSFGELSALSAAGALSPAALIDLALARGEAMHAADNGRGGMSAAFAERSRVTELVAGIEDVVLANHNGPEQVVLSGPKDALDKADERLRAHGVRVMRLPVGGAYHSALMNPARQALGDMAVDLELGALTVPVHGNRDGEPYPPDGASIRLRIAEQLTEPVEFVRTLEAMYAAGARIFVDVGPGAQCAGLAKRILPEGAHVLALDGTELAPLLAVLGQLWALGLPLDARRLFDGRDAQILDLAPAPARERSPTAFFLSGFSAEPVDPASMAGPGHSLLTFETAEADQLSRSTGPTLPGFAAQPALPSPDADAALVAYREFNETMRHFLGAQESVMRMFLGADEGELPTSVADRRIDHAPPPATAEVPPASSTASTDPPAPEIRLGRPEVGALLAETVSAVTGYPPAMLDPSLDVEAELGIDSIKRLEILERLLPKLPDGAVRGLKTQVGAISRLRTLDAWVDAILEADRSSLPSQPAEANVAEPPASKETQAVTQSVPHPRREEQPLDEQGSGGSDPCPVYVMRGRPSSIRAVPRLIPPGLHLVAAGDFRLTRYVETSLRNRGCCVVVIPGPLLEDREAVAAAIADARSEYGPVRGILHLAGAVTGPSPRDLEAWRHSARREAKSLYHMVQACLDDLLLPADSRCGRILAASAFGGAFGRDGEWVASSPLAGAHQGLLRSLQLEHRGLATKCVDLDPAVPTTSLALLLVDEYLAWGGRTEIGFPDGRRTIFDVEMAEMPAVAADLPANAVVLATGGARGITAAVTREIAAPGMTFLLTGRDSFEAEEDPATAGLTGIDALRAHLIEAAQREGGGQRPAELEDALRRLLRDREIRANLAALRAAGATVDYVAMDVRDAEAVGAAIDALQARHGRIDVVLHGAGIIEDARYASKTPESFDRVFDTKVDGAFNILAALDLSKVRALAFFGSTAGRFGNVGQADYAAANEVLNRLGLCLNAQWPDLSVVTFNWGPWDGLGMASDAVNSQFRQRGILPLPPPAAARIGARALLGAPAVELIVGLGDWAAGDCDEQAFFAGELSGAG